MAEVKRMTDGITTEDVLVMTIEEYSIDTYARDVRVSLDQIAALQAKAASPSVSVAAKQDAQDGIAAQTDTLRESMFGLSAMVNEHGAKYDAWSDEVLRYYGVRRVDEENGSYKVIRETNASTGAVVPLPEQGFFAARVLEPGQSMRLQIANPNEYAADWHATKVREGLDAYHAASDPAQAQRFGVQVSNNLERLKAQNTPAGTDFQDVLKHYDVVYQNPNISRDPDMDPQPDGTEAMYPKGLPNYTFSLQKQIEEFQK